MEQKFWRVKRQNQQGISRNLENNAYNAGPYHTIRQPQNMEAYDPWADWFNAGLDPEPFAENIRVEPEENTAPVFFDAQPATEAPWFDPQAWPSYQGAHAFEEVQDDEGDFQYQYEYQYDQERQDQQQRAAEANMDLAANTDVILGAEPPAQTGQSSEERVDETPIIRAEEPGEAEAAKIEDGINTAEETGDERVEEADTQPAKAAGNDRQPIVWHNFPEKSI